jgi:putative oxidoreductase
MEPLEPIGHCPHGYRFVFLYMAARGSGIWSVDAATARAPVGARVRA